MHLKHACLPFHHIDKSVDYLIFTVNVSPIVLEVLRTLSKNVTFSLVFPWLLALNGSTGKALRFDRSPSARNQLGRVPALTKMICVYPSISISFCKCLSSITQKYNLQLLKYLKGKILWLLILLVHKVCKVEI